MNDEIGKLIAGPAARLEYAQQINIAQLEGIRQQKNLLGATSPAEIANAQQKGDLARKDLHQALDAALLLATEQGKPRWLKIDEVSRKFESVDDRIRESVLAGNTSWRSACP